ncbi:MULTISPECIES: sulfurtransferase [Micrococcaceae]|uniref:sulfurtransferase n=1 Tax=Micrococcaceae TaxID=1268 RepID=UPI001616BFE1|nr:sulfurtransferase [Citricoccus sp.]MBB5748343.1 thiosulfate/3-mercaptopyruvate sulfurtransferase [Micrococcus sp. TA1]HRO29499.1 sulfurtransferase [Citricoccus sp.]HRO93546.1 sulfurtransferase [Citricoccus sp.]
MDRVNGAAPVLVDARTVAAWQGHAPAAAPVPDGPPRPGFAATEPRPDPEAVKVLDVRWTALGSQNGHGEYLRGHLPGAVYVSMDSQLAGHDNPREGRHPLPDPDRFGDTVRMLGIDDGDTVVVYDDAQGTSAARAWWLLRHVGLDRTYLLDGGLAAWRAAGLPLQAGEVIPRPGNARTDWGRMPVLDMDSAAGLPRSGLLLDARSAARYRGEEEPLDPQAGHIPGAVSAPTTQNVDEDGRFLPAAELAERFRALGADRDHPVGAYCGSGVNAAHEVAALNIAGYRAALFPGSWSAWSNTPGRPVATGEHP